MSKITKKLLRQIYDMHSIIGNIGSAYQNDRNPERARDIHNLVKKGLDIGQKIIDSQDPL